MPSNYFSYAMLRVFCLQALAPGDDVSCSSTATADEVSLAAAAQLELAAWQARMPLATLLTDSAMQRRHTLMLLHLMAGTEAGAAAGSLAAAAGVADEECGNSPSCSSRVFGDMYSIDAAATAAADVSEEAGDDLSCCAAAVAAALQHYKLIRCDLYQDQFLRNSAALDGDPNTNGRYADDTLQCASLGSTITPSGVCRKTQEQQQQQMGAAASVAELLVWLSRSGQTAAVLQRVLEVAKGEQQLAQQVRLATLYVSQAV
jgi:hypothetical protein